jgi:hypothetical protein
MASQNPQEYYEDESNHGTYVYETLENIVNNFWQQYCGDGKLLTTVKRHSVLYWAKKGLQQFHMDTLREVKAVELELTDNLDIILSPDYLNWVRISWLNEQTGEWHPMAENRNIALSTSYLQDHEANILFDDNGYVLEGTSASENINGNINSMNLTPCNGVCEHCFCSTGKPDWGIDTSKNYNGSFNIKPREGRIHFSSDVATKIITLEYISDGLEYESESNISINKMAEQALYDWILFNLTRLEYNLPDYEKRRTEKAYNKSMTKAKIRLAGFRVAQISQMLKAKNTWIR